MVEVDDIRCAEVRRRLANEFKQMRAVFAALGDETRQQIFAALLENETVGMRVPDLTSRTHLSRPAVSHHLKVLKDAGLVDLYRIGTKNFYYVDAAGPVWSQLKQLVDHASLGVQSACTQGFPDMIERQEQQA